MTLIYRRFVHKKIPNLVTSKGSLGFLGASVMSMYTGKQLLKDKYSSCNIANNVKNNDELAICIN